MLYYIEPEVCGGFGVGTIIDSSTHPPKITQLHIEFDGWLGDDLLEVFPCYIVSEGLAEEIKNKSLSGFILDHVEVSKSDKFIESSPNTLLPNFFWLKPLGKCKENDFWISSDHRLVVSEKVMEILERWKIEKADIELIG
ncbi:hypothetical protein [Vibrio nigripulchritudo]|uniref:hypothetical protein n=1 Tax=Vibrio nigripulchritudo TaxID=28173 RepID=UPI0003B1AC63|nr:hypothetical protein [Vibrio nigripulchritudo]CCN72624.1 conserved hypothetical protein [Vibrio nigripulchritudo SFn118]